MLIERYEIDLEVLSEQDPLYRSPARGCLMHGLLMGYVASDLLHDGTSSARPFSQNLQFAGGRTYTWTINRLDDERGAPVVRWLEGLEDELYLEHYDCPLGVVDVRQVMSMSYPEFMEECLDELPPKYVSFELTTPTAFKKAGQQHYWHWPEARLIAQSALKKWNAFAASSPLDEAEILNEVAAAVSPQAFNIRSRRVAMDGVNFTGAVGQMSFHVQNRPAIRQLFNLCGRYAEYSGLGIKTAMGLGAVTYQPGVAGRRNNGSQYQSSVA